MQQHNSSSVRAQESADVAAQKNVRETIAALFESSRSQLSELVRLFTLELRYSGLMLGVAVAMAVLAVVSAFSLWGLMLTALVAWLLAIGWSLGAALAVVAMMNGMILWVALWLLYRAVVRIGFTATGSVLGVNESDVSK